MKFSYKTLWAFYTIDCFRKYTKVSEQVCISPTRTKKFKEVVKMLHDNEDIKTIGCMHAEALASYL